MTTPDRDDLDDFAELLPTARCRKCGEDTLEVEIIDGLCLDCVMERRQKQKMKGCKESEVRNIQD